MTGMTGRFVSAARSAIVLTVALLVAVSAVSAQEKATAEGIKVHGHWTIDVKNADGTLVSHHEFENALQSGGQFILAEILARKATFTAWGVALNDGSPANFEFFIEESATPIFNYTDSSKTLTVASSTQSTASQLTLQGSEQAPFTLAINNVQTMARVSEGQTSDVETFSRRDLPQSIIVQVNQIVQVTVVFSFS